MPQLELSTYFSQFFWLILCFCILWLMLSLFITPKLSDIIEQRKRKINDYVQKADKLNMQAKEALDRYNTSLAQAEEIAEKEMQKGKDELKAYLSDAENKMTASINRKIADNEFLLAKEKKNTLQQIENISEDLAFEIVKKLGFSNIKRQDIAAIAQKEKQ